MQKLLLIALFSLAVINPSLAGVSDFDKYFKVDMKMEIPPIKEYRKKLYDTSGLYDKGFKSRFEMGRMFKKEFSQTIKFYGLSEGRLKSNYEDDLLEMISWLPKSAYQYIGPMLHQVPGMSEKILNMPGIKETKNKFPEDIAEQMKGIENLEYMSPALYVLLMPELWEPKDQNLDKPTPRQVKKPNIYANLPDYLKEKIGLPVKVAEKKPATAVAKKSSLALQFRTNSPTLTTTLTSKDVAAFVSTIDEIVSWGKANYMEQYRKLIIGETLLDLWEQEQGTALKQNILKDVVNPCQRLVLKTHFAENYIEFSQIVAKQGFTPEEWAYTCDRTIKAFRVLEANPSQANAVRYHRRGYYDKYITQLPKKWQDDMYGTEAAIIKMYAVLKEDVEVVKEHREQLLQKMLKTRGTILTAPIFY